MSVSANACPRNHLYLLNQKLLPPRRSFFVCASRKPEDRRELPAHLDSKQPVLRHEHNRLDEAADKLARRTCIVVLERGVQFLDLAPIGVRDVGVQPRRRRGCRIQLAFELEAATLELI